MEFLDEIKGTELLSSVVLSQSRDPGFVVTFDNGGDVVFSTIKDIGPDCREGVRDSTLRFYTFVTFPSISRIVSSGSFLVSSHSFVCRA